MDSSQPVQPRLRLLIGALVFLVVVLLAVYAVTMNQATDTASTDNAGSVSKSTEPLPTLAPSLAFPSNVDTVVLYSKDVATCVDSYSVAAPKAPVSDSKKTAVVWRSEVAEWVKDTNAWSATFEKNFQACYHTSLATKYTATSAEYKQYTWK